MSAEENDVELSGGQKMSKLSPLIIALLPLLGVLLGASLQYYFSRTAEERKHLETLRTAAYVDFIRGTAGVAIFQKAGTPDKEREYITLLADAKARIAVYGSKPVIEALADFWRGGAILGPPERMRAFVVMVQRMRSESLPKDQKVMDQDISQLLFSLDL